MAVEAHPVGGPVIEAVGRLVAGRYRLRSVLGRGGMGLVWFAEDEVLRRPVALKQVLVEGLVAEEASKARAQTLDEARAAARVDHAGAVRVYDLVEDGGRLWIVMELLSGQTLAQALDAVGPLPIGEVVRIGLCLLDALQAVHRAGIVHRDVKPSNVHLCPDGRVVLTDFGIASATAADPGDSTQPGGWFAGSPGYVSPEQVRDGDIDPAADLFSLGATLFAAVEGQPPFGKGSVFTTLTAVVEAAPGPFLRAGPLRPVIDGLLAKEPELRLTVESARAALQAILPSRLPVSPPPAAAPLLALPAWSIPRLGDHTGRRRDVRAGQPH